MICKRFILHQPRSKPDASSIKTRKQVRRQPKSRGGALYIDSGPHAKRMTIEALKESGAWGGIYPSPVGMGLLGMFLQFR